MRMAANRLAPLRERRGSSPKPIARSWARCSRAKPHASALGDAAAQTSQNRVPDPVACQVEMCASTAMGQARASAMGCEGGAGTIKLGSALVVAPVAGDHA